ncbi:MAG TPA: translation elongation factor Ts [Planctomycetes bacterium]|nr:translation elongation factor Ts [Planctomycetota bacterium]
MAITAKLVMELREKTGAGMMDCKKALEASGGELEAAIDHLRKAGLKSAAKKAERETAEGRVFAVLSEDGHRGHLVAVACETDFLASSDGFISFVQGLADSVEAMDPDGLEDGERPFLKQCTADGQTIEETIKASVGQFGENIRLTALERLENTEGQIGCYIHHDNKQGAIVSVTTGADAATAGPVLKSLCQHIVVFHPEFMDRDEVPADALDREREVILASDELQAKPEEIRGKIVEGKLRRFYSERCLVEQPWILDDKTSVGKVLEKELGAGTKVVAYARVRLG